MSDTLFPNDHAAIAWGHFLAQHFDKINTENFVTSFYPPLNILDQALWDLYAKRWIDTATGEQLNGIGYIVGISRVIQGSVYLAFFGFATQIAGRAFGVARMRHKGEPWSKSSVLADAEYRTIIRLKIALNNGHGTAEEIMAVYNLTLNVQGTIVNDAGNANANVVINDYIPENDPRSQLYNYMIPKAAGVKLNIQTLPDPPATQEV
jgi:hypothetical protein